MKTWLPFVLLVVIGVFYPPSSSVAEQHVPVTTIGAILPLTGELATVGQDVQLALSLSESTANHLLTPHHKRLLLEVRDSGGDPERALRELMSLHAQGVTVFVGLLSSAEAAAALDYANANDLLLISPSSTAPSLALPDNLIRLCPNDRHQVDALMKRFAQREIATIQPVYRNDVYGQDFDAELRRQSAASGVRVLDGLRFPDNARGYETLVRELQTRANREAFAIVLIGFESDAMALLGAASRASQPILATLPWFATDGIVEEPELLLDRNVAAYASRVGLEGFTFLVQDTIPVVPTEILTAFMTQFLERLPAPDALLAVDIPILLAYAMKQADPDDFLAFKASFVDVANQAGSALGQLMALDDNGDSIAAKYSRFKVHQDADQNPYWRHEGIYVRNAQGISYLSDTDTYLTRESGRTTIGALLPLTGSESAVGESVRLSLEQSLQNARVLFNTGYGLEAELALDIRDTASRPEVARQQAIALAQQGVRMIVGPHTSAELEAVADLSRDGQLIFISPTSSAPSLARPDDYIKRLVGDDSKQAAALTRLMTFQDKTFAVVLYRDDRYGNDLARELARQFPGPTLLIDYAADTRDFRAPLEAAAFWLSIVPNGALVVIGFDEVAAILEQVRSPALAAVNWYATDGVSGSRALTDSPVALSRAQRVNLTVSSYEPPIASEIIPTFDFIDYLVPYSHERAWIDAFWLAANVGMRTSPNADAAMLWNAMPFGYLGAGGMVQFDANGDQRFTSYRFERLGTTATGGGEWRLFGFYRDYLNFQDDLRLVDAEHP